MTKKELLSKINENKRKLKKNYSKNKKPKKKERGNSIKAQAGYRSDLRDSRGVN